MCASARAASARHGPSEPERARLDRLGVGALEVALGQQQARPCLARDRRVAEQRVGLLERAALRQRATSTSVAPARTRAPPPASPSAKRAWVSASATRPARSACSAASHAAVTARPRRAVLAQRVDRRPGRGMVGQHERARREHVRGAVMRDPQQRLAIQRAQGQPRRRRVALLDRHPRAVGRARRARAADRPGRAPPPAARARTAGPSARPAPRPDRRSRPRRAALEERQRGQPRQTSRRARSPRLAQRLQQQRARVRQPGVEGDRAQRREHRRPVVARGALGQRALQVARGRPRRRRRGPPARSALADLRDRPAGCTRAGARRPRGCRRRWPSAPAPPRGAAARARCARGRTRSRRRSARARSARRRAPSSPAATSASRAGASSPTGTPATAASTCGAAPSPITAIASATPRSRGAQLGQPPPHDAARDRGDLAQRVRPELARELGQQPRVAADVAMAVAADRARRVRARAGGSARPRRARDSGRGCSTSAARAPPITLSRSEDARAATRISSGRSSTRRAR